MARYKVSLRGCDDVTHMAFDLDFDEWALLKRVAEESARVSDYQCMPTMAVELANNEEEEEEDGEA